MSNNIYYTYELIDPTDNLPFYFGKGKNNRLYFHENYIKSGKIHENWKLHKKIKHLLNNSIPIIYNKIVENVSEDYALKMEEFMIAFYGLDNLCNLTRGGESNVYTHTIEQNKKSSNTRKKLIAEGKITVWNKGLTKETDKRIKPMSVENRKKISEKTKNRIPWNKNKTYEEMYGYEKAQELKEKRRQNMLGDKNPSKNPETIKKIKEGQKNCIQKHPIAGKTYNEYYGEEKSKQIKQKCKESKSNFKHTSKSKQIISEKQKLNHKLHPEKFKHSEEVKKKIGQKGKDTKHWKKLEEMNLF